MDLFYRGFDPGSPLSSGAKHLTAAAERMTVSVLKSFAHLPDAVWREVQKLLNPDRLWALALVLAGWFIASVIGGLIGAAVNALLIVYGLADLWERAGLLWNSLRNWCHGWYEASTEAQLDAAGAYFAEVLSVGGITVLELVLTHKAFKLAEGPLRKRFPAPEWLRKRFEEATQKRRSLGKSEEAKRSRGTSEEPQRVTARTDDALAVLKGNGARELAQGFPTVPVVASVLGVVSAAGFTWWALSSTARSKP